MVNGQIVEGSAKEIAQKITALVGDRKIAVMLIETPSNASLPPKISDEEFDQIMAEIRAHAVSVDHVDDSREGIYTRREGE